MYHHDEGSIELQVMDVIHVCVRILHKGLCLWVTAPLVAFNSLHPSDQEKHPLLLDNASSSTHRVHFLAIFRAVHNNFLRNALQDKARLLGQHPTHFCVSQSLQVRVQVEMMESGKGIELWRVSCPQEGE